MNKQELIAAMAERAGLTKTEAEKALEALQGIVTEELEAGGEIKLVGFAKFEVRNRAPRTGRNPQTGEEVKIPAKRVAACKLTFKLSQPEEKKSRKRTR